MRKIIPLVSNQLTSRVQLALSARVLHAEGSYNLRQPFVGKIVKLYLFPGKPSPPPPPPPLSRLTMSGLNVLFFTGFMFCNHNIFHTI